MLKPNADIVCVCVLRHRDAGLVSYFSSMWCFVLPSPRTKHMFFSATYVAPEILKNIPYDQSADMWSVGVRLEGFCGFCRLGCLTDCLFVCSPYKSRLLFMFFWSDTLRSQTATRVYCSRKSVSAITHSTQKIGKESRRLQLNSLNISLLWILCSVGLLDKPWNPPG